MKGIWKKVISTAVVLACMLAFLTPIEAQAKTMHTVTYKYGAKTVSVPVEHGGNAMIPTDTAIQGYTFRGWVGSAMNVTEDRVISGVYSANTPYASGSNAVSTVKKINDNKSAPFLPWWDGTKGVPGVSCVVRWYNGSNNELWKTQVVPYGYSLPDPADPCISGLQFVGWEGDWTNITEDRAIKAWYYITHKVVFYDPVDKEIFDVQYVRVGEAARATKAPYHPGWRFNKYDVSFDNVRQDMVVTALYDKD